jgi:hypothetical protein
MKFRRLLCTSIYAAVCVSPLCAGVILHEDFESGLLDTLLWESNIVPPKRGGVETRPEYVHSGPRSFRVTSTDNAGKPVGAYIQHFFMPGVDTAYFRWYAMFAGDFDQGNLMHWVFFGGSRVDDKWSCYKDTAGHRPTGTDFFCTFLDTWRNQGLFPPPGRLGFYSSFPEMKIDLDGRYWGNMFAPEIPFLVERGRWYGYEVMVKLNQPGSHDGEQAFWVDGKEIYHQTGIRWRDTEDLKLNSMMLDVYVHQSRQNNTCWFDDVEISTDYIGPLPQK